VFNSTLLGVAAEHGLHALTDWEDPELDECFDEVCHPCSNAARCEVCIKFCALVVLLTSCCVCMAALGMSGSLSLLLAQ
jgi:hypothetical protein